MAAKVIEMTGAKKSLNDFGLNDFQEMKIEDIANDPQYTKPCKPHPCDHFRRMNTLRFCVDLANSIKSSINDGKPTVLLFVSIEGDQDFVIGTVYERLVNLLSLLDSHLELSRCITRFIVKMDDGKLGVLVLNNDFFGEEKLKQAIEKFVKPRK
jgi:hypothetical protein